MRSLDENDWKPFSLGGLFDSLIRGRVSSVAEEPKCYYGVPYVGATDKNNGVLDFLEPNSEKIQQGNCITFIRDGQGSVGSSIYRVTLRGLTNIMEFLSLLLPIRYVQNIVSDISVKRKG